jgi:alpha-beta hydrolase superfamily lysophospholipase
VAKGHRILRSAPLVVALAAVTAVAAVAAQIAGPGTGAGVAYAATKDRPGAIVSSEPIQGAPAGSRGWRIVYRTTTATGASAVASGTVYEPVDPPRTRERFVVSWAHPTLGTGADCTPSQAADPAAAIPGFAEMMARGWVVTSSDYTGLGTDGTLPYLIGAGEARNVIDAVRAARRIRGTDAELRYAVWGHSQGGHAALSTPDFAAAYAPELELVGVAAAAPAAELPALVSLQWQQFVAWVIGSEVAIVWPDFYPGLDDHPITTPVGDQNAERLSRICITADQSAVLAAFGPYLSQPFFAEDPTQVRAWRARLEQNTPTPRRGIASFVAQGLQDDVVLPSTTALLQQRWCRRSARLTTAWFPDATHFSIPSAAAPAAIAWIADRFVRRPASDTCGVAPPVAAAPVPPRP